MEPVKVGVVGLGDHGARHTRIFSELSDAQVIAVCSRTEERAKEIASKYGVPKWYTDYREMMQDSDIAAVDVVTEVARHAEVVLEALQRGKHVLVEKPLTLSLEETDSILDLATKQKRVLMVCWVERFDPRKSLIKQKIESGGLGDLVSLYGRRNGLKRFFDMPRFRIYPIVLEPGIHKGGIPIEGVAGPELRIVGAASPEVIRVKQPER